ncbi:unnamed protein product [Menidia menidia]|uniref:(Atlantic silverside) hypothetical protein n=1 Tax=Menidia menidia TaxID=238744 RepID=A0A8S4ADE2_9TELE|nr:unnamed protein product [Menidia menidia]
MWIKSGPLSRFVRGSEPVGVLRSGFSRLNLSNQFKVQDAAGFPGVLESRTRSNSTMFWSWSRPKNPDRSPFELRHRRAGLPPQPSSQRYLLQPSQYSLSNGLNPSRVSAHSRSTPLVPNQHHRNELQLCLHLSPLTFPFSSIPRSIFLSPNISGDGELRGGGGSGVLSGHSRLAASTMAVAGE